ncbi:hypothetical protein [Priestia megaterium]|uniref:hypothetical protein n=1 Tax=Priestia megaterium TaxID=1404 RepID=UPI0015970B03|nr:hypothetical protein [Priestia megaterium]
MKIKEILELSQSKRLAEIAKEHLEIGEKKAVAGLKEAGCFNISGKRGWYFEGDKSVLEKSIYEFVPPSKRGKKVVSNSAEKEVSATIETPTAKINPSSQLPVKTVKKQENNSTNKKNTNTNNKLISKQLGKPTNQLTSKPTMKKVTYEIEENLHDELKIKAIREKRTVSEIVNDIIKQGLK